MIEHKDIFMYFIVNIYMNKNKSSLTFNAILNMLKQACSILFPLITFPYASRVLGVESYGKYSFSNSIVSYFVLLAGLGISTYAIREGARIRENEEKLSKFINEVFSINVVSSLLSIVLLTLLIIFWKKLHSYTMIIYIESLIIIFNMLGSDWINSIFEDYRYITIRYIIIQVLAIAPIFYFVNKPEDYLIYTFIIVLAGYGGNLVNILYIKKYVKRSFTWKLNLKRHMKPILILFSTMVAVRIYLSSDITMIGAITNNHETGVYGAVSKIYTMSKELINAITIVMVPRISNLLQKRKFDEYNKLASFTLNSLLTLILPITVGIVILSKDVIAIVNGKQYISGYLSLIVLCIALPFAVMSCFYSNAILVPNRKEKYFLISTSCAALINIGLNLIFITKIGMLGAAFTTLIAEIIVFIMVRGACVYQRLINVKYKFNNFISIILGTLLIICVCILVKNNTQNELLRVFLCIAISGVVYFLILKIFDNDLLRLIDFRKNKF